jgi:hypothetical protein
MVPLWWDNGVGGSDGFGILNRTSSPVSWYFPTIAQALCNCASQVSSTAPGPLGENRTSLYGLVVKANAVSYSLPAASFVSVRVYTMKGTVTAILVKSVQTAGNHEVKLPTNRIASGHYLLELKAGNTTVTKNIAFVQ